MICRRSPSSERAPWSVVPCAILSLAFLLPLSGATAAGAGFLPPPPQRPSPVGLRSMDGAASLARAGAAGAAGGGRSSLTPSPILLSSSPKNGLTMTTTTTMMAAGRAGGDGMGGQEQQEQEQRGLNNWGAHSVTAGSSTVAAQHLQRQAQQQTHQQHAASSSSSSLSTADIMSLDSIRSTLIRQEDSIIFALIERAQFRRNAAIYARGILQLEPSVPEYDFLRTLSFLEYLLLETEKLHGKVRRYTSPEEHAFFPEHIPPPILAPLQFPQLLAGNAKVDVNREILSLYIDEIVPAICKPGDDEQHGSSVLADITLLQAISKRVHLGKFVAETKFQESEAQYRRLVMGDDVDGVMELLTNRAVEERVLERAKLKASTYGQDITGQTAAFKVEPAVIAAIYRDIVIPLTKDVEVLYLFERVGRQPPTPLPPQRYRLQLEEDKI